MFLSVAASLLLAAAGAGAQSPPTGSGATVGPAAATTTTGRAVPTPISVYRYNRFVREGEPAVFTVSRLVDLERDLTVNVDVTETGGFVTDTGVKTVRLAPGRQTARLTVPTVDRQGPQEDGAVVAEVLAGEGYEPNPTPLAPRTIAILDDDPPEVSIEFDGSAVRAGERAPFTLHRRGNVGEELEVYVKVERQRLDFRAGEDQLGLTFYTSYRVAAGSPSRAVESAAGVAGYAGGRIILTIIRPRDGSYNVAEGAGTVTVEVATEVPTVYVTAEAASVREGALGLFEVTRIGRLDNAVRVSVSLSTSWDASSTTTLVDFGAGVGRVRVGLATGNDTAADDEFVRVTIESSPDYRRVENIAADGVDWRTAETRVVNSDPPRVRIGAGPTPVTEGEYAVFTLEREAGRGAELTVNVAVTEEGEFILGAAPTAVTFGAQDLTATLRVPTEDDSIARSSAAILSARPGPSGLVDLGYEENGSITARIVPAADERYLPPAGAGDASATVEVRDNDPGIVWIYGNTDLPGSSSAIALVREGDPLRFLVFRQYGNTAHGLTAYVEIGPRMCHFGVGGGFNSPFPPEQPLSGIPVVFGPGETRAELVLPTKDDEIAECSVEWWTWLQRGASYDIPNVKFRRKRGVETIFGDDDHIPPLRVLFVKAGEGKPRLEFPVTLAGIWSLWDFSVGWEAVAGTATEGEDYVAASGTLVFEPTTERATVHRTIEVPLLDDDLYEGDETLTIRFTPPEYPQGVSVEVYDLEGVATSRDATGTIVDNERVTRVSIADGQLAEDSDEKEMSFTITVSPRPQSRVSVRFRTVDGTATGTVDGRRVDYGTTRGLRSFFRAQTPKVVRVPIKHDWEQEGDETFAVELYEPVGLEIDRGVATGTIIDHVTPEVTIAADADTVEEGEAVVFTLTRDGDTTDPLRVTVDVTITEEGKAPTVTSITRSFAGGSDTLTLSLGTRDDAVVNEPRVYRATIRAPSIASWRIRDPGWAEVTVEDNDAARALVVERSWEGGFREAGDTLTFRYVVHNRGTVPADGAITISDDRAGTVACPTGETPDRLPADSTVDCAAATYAATAADVAAREIVSTATATDGTTTSAAAAVTVPLAGDPPLSIADATAVEGDGAIAFTVTLGRDASDSRQVTVDWATENGSATGGVDFTAATGALTFGAGVTEQTLSVSLLDDDLDEPDEDFRVRLSDAVNGVVADAAATGAITDDDDAVRVTFETAASRYAESGGCGTEGCAVDVLLTDADGGGQASGRQVEVTFETAAPESGTAAAAGEDYLETSGALTFSPGDTRRSIAFAIVDDELAEGDEGFRITLKGPANAELGAVTSHAVTIGDDDERGVTVAPAALTVAEGATADYTVRLASQPTGTVTVAVAAPEGAEFTVDPTSLQFTAGTWDQAERVTVTAAVDDDAVAADPAALVHTPAGGGYGAAEAAALPVVTVTETTASALAVGDAAGAEDAGRLAFEVTLSAALGEALTVPWETRDGTAASGDAGDYAAASGTLTFSPGEALTQAIRVTIRDDDEDEPEESFEVVLGAPSLDGVMVVGDGVGTGTIADDDLPSVSIAARAASVREGEAVVFEATREGDVAAALEVGLSVEEEGRFLAGEAPGSVVFEADAATAEVRLETEDDALDEPDGRLRATLAAGAGWSVSASAAAAETAVLDDDGLPVLAIAGAAAAESAGAVEFAVELGAASGRRVTVRYETADGTATAGADYTETGGTLSFDAGETERTIRVPIGDDTEDEPESETFTVTLSVPEHATLQGGAETLAATGTITDDDLPRVAIAGPADPVEEGGEVRFTLTRAGVTTSGLTVAVGVTLDGDFFSGAPPSAVTFDAGASEAALVVATVGDGVDEPDGSVTATLTAGAGYVLADAASATAEVLDDDGQPSLTIADARGAESAGSLTFTVTLSAASARPVTVDYATADGTATAGTDYTANDGELTFAAGVTERTVTVTIEDDGLDEADAETFRVALTGAVNAQGSPSATGTIEDDDATPALAVAGGAVAESGGSLDLTVTLSAASGRPVSATWATVAGTATAPDDFASRGGLLAFDPGGPLEQTITVTIADDDLAEGDEAFALALSDVVNADAGDDATVTITDDDAPTAAVTADAGTVVEGGAATFTVALAGGTGSADVTAAYAVGGTATAGADYTAPGGSLTIPAGEPGATITVRTTADDVVDPGETLVVTLTGASTSKGMVGFSPAAATTTISDTGTATVSVASAGAVAEGAAAAFTVTLSGAAAGNTVLGWTTGGAGDTAAGGDDYTARSGTLTIPANETAGTVTVQTVDDALAEGDETFTLTLAGTTLPAGVSLGTATATGTITDDDTLRAAVTGAATVTEGSAATFAVALTGGTSTADVRVTWTVGGTATSGTDWTAQGRSMAIPAGESSATITIETLSDGVLDPGEKVTVTLTGASTAKGAAEYDDTAAETTITDGGMVSVSVSATAASTVEEGGDAAFTVTLSGAAGSDTVLGWTTGGAGDTAAGGDDYTAVPSGTLTIRAGDTTGTLAVSTADDALAEDDEAFTVTIAGTALPPGVTLGAASATGTITDDEVLTAGVTAGPATVAEGDPAGFTVTLTGGASTADVAVTYTVGGTATPGTDYTAPGGSLTIPAGEPSGTITIETTADGVLDRGETLIVTLTGADTAMGRAEYGTAWTTTIADTGAETVSVASDGAVTEGAEATFTVTLSGAAADAAVLGWSTAAGTAASGLDYTAVPSGTLTIAAGETTGTLTVSTTQDALAEADETFMVTIAGTTLPPGVTLGTRTATATIEDDEAFVAIERAGAASRVEGARITFTLSRTTTAGALDVTVDLSETGDVAYPDDEGRRTVSFADGAASASFTLRSADDRTVESSSVVTVAIVDMATYGTGSPATAVVTVTDNDVGLVYAFADSALTVAETAGTVSVSVRATTDGDAAPVNDYPANVQTHPGTASAPGDYARIGQPVIVFRATEFESVTTADGARYVNTLEIDLRIEDDSVDEATESFELVMAQVPGVDWQHGPRYSEITITDDDERGVTVSPTALTIPEGGSAQYAVVLTSAPGVVPTSTPERAVEVTIGGVEGDVGVSPKSLTFTDDDWDTPQTVTVTAGQDANASDQAATLTHAVAGADYQSGGVTARSVAVTVTDDDVLTAGVTVAAETAEGSPASFTVALTGATSTADVAVTYRVGGTATSGVDYTAPSGSLTIRAGASSGTIAIPTASGDALDPGETLTVTLTGASTTAGTVEYDPSPATTTIVDTGSATVSVSATAASTADEGDDVSFTVTLTGAAASETVLGWTTGAPGDTATSDVDYTAVTSGTLRIRAGDTTGTLTVSTTEDTLAEADETFTVTITGTTLPPGVSLGTATATGTITDDEGAPAVSLVLSPSSISENGGVSTVTATLSAASSELVTVTVSASPISPAVSGDFTQSGATLTIAAGDTTSTGTVTLTAVNNAVDAPDKTVTVSGAASGGNGVSAPSSQTLTITDDEGAPAVSLVLTPSSVTENGGVSAVTATLSAASSETVTVTVSASPVSPAVAGDFTQNGTTLTIAAGETTSTGTVTLTAVNNAVDAPDKTVTVSGSASGGNGVSAPSSQTLTITDDEGAPAVALVLTPSSVTENGGVSAVTATLSPASSETVTVTVSASPVSPAVSGDFTQNGATLTIAAGDTTSTGTVTLTAVNNAVDAPDKTVTVSGSASGGNGVSAPSSQTLTITDDEGAPAVALVLTPSSVTENGGVSTVTATLSPASSETVTVTVSASPVSPAVSGDFTQNGTTLTIAAGDTTSTGTVTLTAVNNAVDAPDKTVTVSGAASGGNGVSAPSSQTLTITDDEGAPAVSLVLTPSSVTENGGVSTVTATLSPASSETVTVTVSASPVSPAVSGDFTQNGTTLTIAAGDTTSTGTVTLTAVNNAVDAPDKTVTVSGSASGGNGVSAPSSQTLTITDDEGAPAVALVLTPSSVTENGGVSAVTATLSPASSELVTVTVSASPVSPAVSGDFTQNGTTLTIAAGDTTSTGTVTLTAVNNAVDAPDKTVTVSGSASGGNGVSAPSSQTLTITDDEGAPAVALVLTPSSVTENGGVSTVTATLSPASSETVTVTVSASPVSPAVSGDFTQNGTTLTIAAGDTTSTGTVTLTAVNNAVDAPDKTVTVSGSASGGNGVSAPSSQTLTITDDEGAPAVALVLTPSSVTENGGVSAVTATLSPASSELVTVTVSASPVSPAVSGDFTQNGTTLTIAAGDTTSTGTVTLTAVNNAVDAPDKTVTVSGAASGGNGVSAPSSQTLTITDDEGAPAVALVLTPSSVTENGGVSTVTATLSAASSELVTVTVSATPVSPCSAGDFTQNGTTLTIAAGDTTSTGTVT